MDKQKIGNRLTKLQQELRFSGAFYAHHNEKVVAESYGYANRSEKIKNELATRFSIASGSKIFTSVAICQLVEKDKIAFDTKVKDFLEIDFPYLDQNVTIDHLLTHTSGVPDYFDEDTMDDYEVLWESLPMYRVRSARDFLPLFQYKRMENKRGNFFKYNNTGYIILGLIIEQVSGIDYSEYIEQNIFQKVGMANSGYFSMDALPEQVALGYIENTNGQVKTNIFSLPAKGGPDGGAYVTVKDIVTFWKALLAGEVVSKKMTEIMLKPRVIVDGDILYGYGGYLEMNEKSVVKYIQMGYDPGVNYRLVHYPDLDLTIAVCSNNSDGAYEMLKEMERMMLK